MKGNVELKHDCEQLDCGYFSDGRCRRLAEPTLSGSAVASKIGCEDVILTSEETCFLTGASLSICLQKARVLTHQYLELVRGNKQSLKVGGDSFTRMNSG